PGVRPRPPARGVARRGDAPPGERDRAGAADGTPVALAGAHERAAAGGRDRAARAVEVVRPDGCGDGDACARAGAAAASAARRLPGVRNRVPGPDRRAALRGGLDRVGAPPRAQLALRPRQVVGRGAHRHVDPSCAEGRRPAPLCPRWRCRPQLYAVTAAPRPPSAACGAGASRRHRTSLSAPPCEKNIAPSPTFRSSTEPTSPPFSRTSVFASYVSVTV